jgi:undecaprenyl-diphosphatase
MIEFFYSIDVAVFFFINHTIANPIFDWVMPFLTDLNKNKPALWIIGLWVVYVLWKGGRTGRITIGILLLTIIISDQFNSFILKGLFERVRPCRALDGVRMLVDCGGGFSFPSSHAVNNFAGATVISHFYRKQHWYWFTFAAFVALSRPYVGVHYPSDIVAGGVIGFLIGFTMTKIWEVADSKFNNRLIKNNTKQL